MNRQDALYIINNPDATENQRRAAYALLYVQDVDKQEKLDYVSEIINSSYYLVHLDFKRELTLAEKEYISDSLARAFPIHANISFRSQGFDEVVGVIRYTQFTLTTYDLESLIEVERFLRQLEI